MRGEGRDISAGLHEITSDMRRSYDGLERGSYMQTE